MLDGRGRLLPFDPSRLAASLARVLPPGSPVHAADVAALIGQVLARSGALPVVSGEHVHALVHRALAELGLREAADAWSAGRPSPGHRLADLAADRLAGCSDVPRSLVRRLAEQVGDTLAAAGLDDATPALLDEALDHLLRRAGLDGRLGRRAGFGLPGHHLRRLLADGGVGRAAEARIGAALLERYVVEEVLPSPVADAHADGVLGLQVCTGVAGLVLPAGQALASPPADRAALAGLVEGDLVLVLPDGCATELADRLLVPGSMPSERLVLAAGAGEADQLLARLPRIAEVGARLLVHGTALPVDVLAAAAAEPNLCLAPAPPRPGLVGVAGSLELLRLARRRRAGEVGAFLDDVVQAMRLLAQGLSALAVLGPSAGARRQATQALGPALPERWAVTLHGPAAAVAHLLGDSARGRERAPDLLAALGERVARAWQAAGPAGTAPPRLGLGADAAEPSDPAAHARLRRLLGVAPETPLAPPEAPAAARAAWLAAALASSSSAEAAPCA